MPASRRADTDYELLRQALAEQQLNARAVGRAPSSIAMNAYLGEGIPLSHEQQREAFTLDEMDQRTAQSLEDDRKRRGLLDAAQAAAAVRGFETRRGVEEEGGLVNSPSPRLIKLAKDEPRAIRRFGTSDAMIDPDTGASALDKASRDPRVIAEKVRAAGDLEEVNAKTGAALAGAAAKDDEDNVTRDEIIRLATEIRDSGALNRNVGPLDSWLPTLRGSSHAFESKTQRLRDLLALEARGKLKGQGAVSDFEGKMLANSQTALSQDTDEGTFRAELDRIIEGQRAKRRGGGVKRYNPETREIE